MNYNHIKEKIFAIESIEEFERLALEVFIYQAEFNPVYREFIMSLGMNPLDVKEFNQIPFIPVGFFRNHRIITGNRPVELTFESSGTTGGSSSFHYVTDADIYQRSFTLGFKHFFGNPEDWMIAALLPSYEERGNSSLVYMVNHLATLTKNPNSGFYTRRTGSMIENLQQQVRSGGKAMLIGVTYALLDLAEGCSDLSGVHVVETGGMKGRRREMIREELHSVLVKGLNIERVHSEYGMTELLSQAWSGGNGIFRTPPWMRISIREFNDPQSVLKIKGVTGGINVADLANINSCSFIATQDLGRESGDGEFEIIGRFDNSDIRGCNLLYQ